MLEQDTEQEDIATRVSQAEDESFAYKQSLGLVTTAPNFLTPQREKELWQRRHEERAKAEIITAHLPLCGPLIREAYSRSRWSNMAFEDLEGEAYKELVVSYDKYDPHNEWNARFCSYVTSRIKHALLEFTIQQGSNIKQATTKEQRSLFAHWSECNRIAIQEDPTRSHYQRKKRISELMAQRTSHKNIDIKTIDEFEARRSSAALSMNMTLGSPDGSFELQDTFASEADTPDVCLEKGRDADRMKDMMTAALSALTERERAIIEQRILCEDGEKKDLHELGAVYGVSAERIRQIEAKALQKMRKFIELDGLTIPAPTPSRKALAPVIT